MSRLIFIIESNLVWFVIGIALLGLLVPASGQFLEPAIGLMLALSMFVISLTFDAHDVRLVLRKPSSQILALGFLPHFLQSFR